MYSMCVTCKHSFGIPLEVIINARSASFHGILPYRYPTIMIHVHVHVIHVINKPV